MKTKTKKRSLPSVVKPQSIEVSERPKLNGQIDLIAMALEKNATMDTIERLIALYDKEKKDRAFKAFHEAMGKCQEQLPTIKHNRSGYNNSYTFADIDQIVQTIKGTIAAFGFTYRYEFNDIPEDKPRQEASKILIGEIMKACAKYLEPGSKLKEEKFETTLAGILSTRNIEVTCIVTHREGHSERTTMKGPEDFSGFKNSIQSRGSTLTYLERQTLIGAFALTSANRDNDGATKKDKQQAPPDEQQQAPAEPKKEKLPSELLNRAIIRISKGEDILQKCKDEFALTTKQLEALEAADQIRKTKPMK